jgi:peptide/nickel transport system substrate-binding protein
MLPAVEPGRSRPLGVLVTLVIGVLTLWGTLALWPAPPPARAADGQITLAVHISLAPTWFDPAETAGVITPFLMLYALHDALVKPMPGNAWTPSLAESWTQSKDGLIYEFVLRKGVRFHNGDLLTAEDVKFSFERYKGAGAGRRTSPRSRSSTPTGCASGSSSRGPTS